MRADFYCGWSAIHRPGDMAIRGAFTNGCYSGRCCNALNTFGAQSFSLPVQFSGEFPVRRDAVTGGRKE